MDGSIFSHPESEIAWFLNIADVVIEFIDDSSAHDYSIGSNHCDYGLSHDFCETCSMLEGTIFNLVTLSGKYHLNRIRIVCGILFMGTLSARGTLGTRVALSTLVISRC
jgi:hypothetical protein